MKAFAVLTTITLMLGLAPMLWGQQPLPTLWDDLDSHKWIGENWGDSITVEYVKFEKRQVLKAKVTSRRKGWALIRTDAFPVEDWSPPIKGFKADIYREGGHNGIDVKLEVRGTAFDPAIPHYYNDLEEGWNTCTWMFQQGNYRRVAYVSIVFDHLDGTSPTFYVDNLRFITDQGDVEWDDMDDPSHRWIYGGDWVDWSGAGRKFGLEPISHRQTHPSSPAGAAFLKWDYEKGKNPNPDEKFAEISTPLEFMGRPLELNEDWRQYKRISADVWCSDSVPISLFIWDNDQKRGFGTSTKIPSEASKWVKMTWECPWPTWFNQKNVDQVKFVVNELDKHKNGVLYVDNITLEPE